MDSFSLEGLETTSLSAPPPPPPQPATAEVPTIDLDFGAPAPATQAAAPVEAPVLDIGDFAPPTASAPVPDIALDIPVATPEPAPPVAEIDLGFAAPAPAPAEVAQPVELVAELPIPAMEVEMPAAPAGSPFVTETMAELYLQQGHRDEALRVYRALLESKPDDAGLRAKVESLEAPPMPAAAVGGPTIREVLILIAQRRPGYRPEGSNGAAHADQVGYVADAAPSAAYESAPDAGSRPIDLLGALWGNVEPDPAEEGAAIMLAMAFADLNGIENGGAPALDLSGAAAASTARPSVAVPAPTAPPSSFSFDKFFSPRVTAEHAAQASGAAAKAESREDVAQFTRWLEGLKQQ